MGIFIDDGIKLEKVSGVSSHADPEITVFGLDIVFFQSYIDSTSNLFVK